MKRMLSIFSGAVVAATFSVAASAQQDLEVTLDVVPPGASAGAATSEIRLPENAAPEGRENAAFGVDTANKARALRGDLDEEFGRDVSEAARDRAQEHIPNIGNPGRP